MNAIILAAGMGTRLRPLTNDIPKCLVKVSGVPMVERQIQYLHEAGITDITLVSGYKAEKLNYLKDKYGVDIVFNERYDTCNNIYSLYKVLDRFGDTWVIEGDVFMNKNCFTKDIHQSTYFAKYHEHYENEWGLETDENGKLVNINIGSGQGCIMSGISFWTKDDATRIENSMLNTINNSDYSELFWDNIVLSLYHSLDILICCFNEIYEIDNEKDLREVERLVIYENCFISEIL